ncbi:MAG: hypothetical protein GY948_01415 [Alphaproteobacteria bacterium]|nr:hypothetical protein [Alphaproteobacteria bacterium]
MTTAAAPNQLPESLFSPEHEGQVSAPLTPEQAPEGVLPEAGMTENGLPQMPPEQLQQALAQQFHQVPAEQVQPAPTEPAMQMPTEPAAQMPAEPMAQMPAEPVAQMPTEPMAQMPAEPVAAMPAEPMAQVAAEPVAQMPAEPIAQVPAEPVAQLPVEQMAAEPVQHAQAPAPEMPQQVAAEMQAPQDQAMNAQHVLAEHVATPELVAAQMAGHEPPAAAPAPETAETVLAAMPHPDTYQQLPPATANAEHAVPALAPEAQSQLQPEARYVPNELAVAAAPAPEAMPAPEMAAPATAPVAAQVQPADVAVGIPGAFEALSQPGAEQAPMTMDPAAQMQPQDMLPAAVDQTQIVPAAAELAQPVGVPMQQPELQQMYADAMAAEPAGQIAAMPEAQMPVDPQAAEPAPAEMAVDSAQLAPGAAGVALATEIPAISQLPADNEAEKPVILSSDLRQLSTVSAETQKKGGLAGLFSKKQDPDTPAPAQGRVSVLGGDAGEKKKGFSLSGLFSRKKKAEEVTLPQPVLADQEPEPAAAKPADVQIPILTPGIEPAASEEAPAGEETSPVREEIMLFIGKNAEAFEESWENHHKADGKLQMSWSTPGFLLSFMWLAYRKLHKFALGGFALVAGMTLVHGYAALAAMFVLMVAVGLFGKSLYVRMVSNRVMGIMQFAGDPNIYVNNLRLQGGVSLPAALCLGVLILVVAGTKVIPGLL